MTTPASGPLSIKDVSGEVGLPPVSENSLNGALSRQLAGILSGTISINDMYARSLSGSVFNGTSLNTRVLVVAGGGGGGIGSRFDNRLVSGGGGAGGYIDSNILIPSGTTTVTVGGGGVAGGNYDEGNPAPTQGANSVISGLLTAIGGGRAGR